MRLFQAPFDTPLDSPFSVTLSVHGLCAFKTTNRILKLGFRQLFSDCQNQEPLNAPFLSGLFARGFSREKTGH